MADINSNYLDKLYEDIHREQLNLMNKLKNRNPTEPDFEKEIIQLKSTNEKCNIYFSWVHNEKQSENIIKNELLNEYFKKYNWKVLNIFNTNNNNLAECYSWYVIRKQ